MTNMTDEIISAIRDIYAMYGIKSVTMDDLARELGVSKKTLYEHFNDKEEVVRKVIDLIIADHQSAYESIINQPGNNAIDELLLLSRFITEHLKSLNPSLSYDLKKYYPGVWNHLVNYKSKTVFEQIMANIRKGVKEGLFRENLKYEIIAHVYVSRMELFSPGGLPELEAYTFQDIFRTLFEYHVRGISNERGQRHLEALLLRNENDI
jgi:TetR/AcrR family transcriptional regulator, cholesterol catabolism regulator